MSKRAEEAALKAYPQDGDNLISQEGYRLMRTIYAEGYEQAEKDLEPIRTHLQNIVESAKRILALDGKDADVCDAVQDILVAAKSIEWTITEE